MVKDFLADYVKAGNTFFISTHILEIVDDICTKFTILHNGKLLHTGTVADVKSTDKHLDGFFLSLVWKDGHV